MIQLNNISQEAPYLVFKDLYEKSSKANQKKIEAISIASYSSSSNEVNSRFVNLKFINDRQFIFFSNYNSPKSVEFHSHNQINGLIYWDSINVQIRMKAKIKKTSSEFNQNYFCDRSEEKNALAISSYQSKEIDSYEQVKENYNKSLESDDLKKCPEYWGGYSFIPYYFEFWEGHGLRINKREAFDKINDIWKHSFLQP
jgi:pyridoxamine 5'-phosphate oxidase